MRRLPAIQTFFEQSFGWWVVLFGLCALLLAPIAITDFPPVLDYPNHLARLFILAHAGANPTLDRMWQPSWAIIPDLGIDLFVPPLVRALGPFPAGKIMLAFALLAPMIGAIVYSRAAFRVRLYWPMSAGLIAYNIAFVLGFINYLISLGGAMAAAGLWLWIRERPILVRGIAASASACALFFVHLFGLAFFCLLVIAAEVSGIASTRGGGRPVRGEIATTVSLVSATLAGPLVLWRLAPNSPHSVAYDWSLIGKLFYICGPFLAYHALPGLLAALAFTGVTIVWITNRNRSFAPGILFVLLGLLAAYACAPFALGGATFVDARIPQMLALSLSAGVRPPPGLRRLHWGAAVILVLGFATAWISVVHLWGRRNEEAGELRASIAAVPAGSRVLVTSPRVDMHNAYWQNASPRVLALGILRIEYQLPALLVIDRNAFWPFLFSDPSQHPIRVRPPYDTLAVPQGAPPDLESLVVERSLDRHWPAPFLRNWPANFDYVLLLNAAAVDKLPASLADKLEPINRFRFAALFRIRRPSATVQPNALPP